jgi:hypothetical protein
MKCSIILVVVGLLFSQQNQQQQQGQQVRSFNFEKPKSTFLESDIFDPKNPDRARFYVAENYNFIGLDPNEQTIPDFHLTDRTVIDTINFRYVTRVNSMVYIHELDPYRGSDGRTHLHYAVKIEVLDENDEVVAWDQEEKKIGILSSVYKDNLFYKSHISFTFNLEPGEYTLKGTFWDRNSNMVNAKSYKIYVRKTAESDILISDVTFIDEHLNEEVFGHNNAFMNRKGHIVLEFDTYKKTPENSYSYTVEMTKKLTVSETLQESIRQIFSAPAELIRSLMADTLEMDTIYQIYYGLLYDTESKYNRFQIRMPKTIFSNITFPLQFRKRRLIQIEIQPKLNVVREVEIDPDDLEDDIVLADSLKDDENFMNSIITSKVSELQVIDHVENVIDEFTFTWDSIPQTRAEMDLMLKQMRTFIDNDTLDYYMNSSVEEAQEFYGKYWTDISFNKHRLEGMKHARSFIKKVRFANDNFFDFISVSGVLSEDPELMMDPVHKNGWNSDKGLLYLKYGLPDEMSGTNYIGTEGNVLRLQKQPYQRWVYSSLNKEYFFIGNRLVRER